MRNVVKILYYRKGEHIMQDILINDNNTFTLLAEETESLLEDIFVSGFHGIRQSIIDKLSELLQIYKNYGMNEGYNLLHELMMHLIKQKDSFSFDISDTMKAYTQVEFYIENMKGYI